MYKLSNIHSVSTEIHFVPNFFFFLIEIWEEKALLLLMKSYYVHTQNVCGLINNNL